jgi:hypothetical protein
MVIFEYVTFFPYHLYSLSIHYKASRTPNYIVIPMLLNNNEMYEVMKHFKVEIKVCLEVPFPFIPGCMHVCLLIKSELFLKLCNANGI